MTTETISESFEANVGSWGDNPNELGLKQRVFGELVKLAMRSVEHYHSDLYHDARWVEKYVHGEQTFYFGFDEWGTSIGTDEDLVRTMRPYNVYRMEITKTERKAWILTATRVEL